MSLRCEGCLGPFLFSYEPNHVVASCEPCARVVRFRKAEELLRLFDV